MKRFLKYSILFFAVAVGVVSLSFSGEANTKTETIAESSNFVNFSNFDYDDAVSGIYTYAFPADTITDTEVDVLTIPSVLISKWSYNWTISTTQLSGTQKLSCQISESNTRTGTDWLNVGSAVTTSGSTDLDRAVGEILYGMRQRMTITGTGTQSTRYVVTVTLKK